MHRSIPALVGALALAVATHAAEPVRFDIKSGLWETTSTGKSGGQMPIPDAMLQKLSPEQREKLTAGMQSMMTKPETIKSCLTADTIAKTFAEQHVREGCEHRVVTNTSSDLAVTGGCDKGGGGSYTYTLRFQRQGREAVTGNVSLVYGDGAKAMRVERVFNGKWLGASCGAVK